MERGLQRTHAQGEEGGEGGAQAEGAGAGVFPHLAQHVEVDALPAAGGEQGGERHPAHVGNRRAGLSHRAGLRTAGRRAARLLPPRTHQLVVQAGREAGVHPLSDAGHLHDGHADAAGVAGAQHGGRTLQPLRVLPGAAAVRVAAGQRGGGHAGPAEILHGAGQGGAAHARDDEGTAHGRDTDAGAVAAAHGVLRPQAAGGGGRRGRAHGVVGDAHGADNGAHGGSDDGPAQGGGRAVGHGRPLLPGRGPGRGTGDGGGAAGTCAAAELVAAGTRGAGEAAEDVRPAEAGGGGHGADVHLRGAGGGGGTPGAAGIDHAATAQTSGGTRAPETRGKGV